MAHSSKGFLIVCALILAVGCNGSSPSAPEMGGLAVDPSSVTTLSGNSAQFSATGEGGGAQIEGVSWSSSDPAIAMIDDSGKMTAGFSAGRAVITARAGAAVGRGEVNVVRACANPVAIDGDPGPGGTVAREFDVRFGPGEDAARLTAEFAAQYGFQPIEVYADGFLAVLTTAQINPIVCRTEVATISFG